MFEFTKEQETIREMVRGFAETELASKALEIDAKGEFPNDLVKKLADHGLIGVMTAKELGGSAAGHLAGTIVIEELARVYPSIAFFLEVSQAPIYAVEQFGTEAQKNRYLPPVIKGEKIFCFAATEATGGSALATLSTDATSVNEGYIINGRKVYITNGDVADYCILLAKTGDRASVLLVEKGTDGFRIGRRQNLMGFKSVHINELTFSDCVVPKKNLIGKEEQGLAIATSSFVISRPFIGAIGLGIARGAFEIALKYAKGRVLCGKPISSLQAIQFMLVDMETEIEAAKWLIYYPGTALDRGMNPRDIGKYSARAKVVGAEVALNVTQKAMQILGGCGVTPEYHLVRLLSDAMQLFPATGSTQIMKTIQAGEILKH